MEYTTLFINTKDIKKYKEKEKKRLTKNNFRFTRIISHKQPGKIE